MLSLARRLEFANVVVLTGVGKSGDVARLGASLLQSVGINAQFIHAVDMLHGGLGVLNTHRDYHSAHIIAFSHSGETAEIVTLFHQVPAYVETTLITAGRALHIDVDNYFRYDCPVDGSIHETIPVYSSVEQVRLIGELASTIANDLTAEQLLNNHPAGKLAAAYTKEMACE